MTTGLAYHPIFLEHDTGTHPERGERLRAIVQYLQASGLWERLAVWEPRPAEPATLALVHSAGLIEQVRRAAESGGAWLDPDTVVSPRSYEAAQVAVGAVVEAARRVLQGDFDSAIALPRPPGHHATPDRAMGFCLFNNVALAAQQVLSDGLAERVYIVDIDVHHGNGTQDCFYDRSDVLYFSAHQFPFYPGSGSLRERGAGEGLGFTVNVPLPAGSGDQVYARVAREIIAPLADRHRPDLVLVSLGMDAFWDDPLAGMALSVGGYAEVIRQVYEAARRICGGRVVVALEGGYNLRGLAYGIAAVAHVLLQEPIPEDLLLPCPAETEPLSANGVVDAVREQEGL